MLVYPNQGRSKIESYKASELYAYCECSTVFVNCERNGNTSLVKVQFRCELTFLDFSG